MTRLISGRAGGRRLLVPKSGTRPTSDRVREALFASLEARLLGDGRSWHDCDVCDLWAGSGALGLEAWSRGASRVVAVEKSSAAVEVIAKNIRSIGAEGAVDVRRGSVENIVRAAPPSGPFDVVFADPPYADDDASVQEVLKEALGAGWFAPHALVIVERSIVHRSQDRSGEERQPLFPAGIESLDNREYGDTVLWYGRAT